MDLLLKGLFIGFVIAAPVGPIGILCIQRSLHDGFRIGLMTGLGAAVADGVYGLVAAFGLTSVSSLLVAQQFWIRWVGGLFLIYLGTQILLKKPHANPVKAKPDRSIWHAFVTTFFLTLTNPMTILAFVAVFAGLGLVTANADYINAIFLVVGITCGSAIWWLLLSGGVAFVLHHRLGSRAMRVLNLVSGVIMVVFGLWALKG